MKIFLIAAVIALASCGTKQEKGPEIFETDGVAIKGYDPVAFHTQGRPVKGNPALTYEWKDANWQFSTQANLDSFRKSPEKYAPQYGGYCAYGTAEGHKAPTETDTWTVWEGKLYFNYNKDVQQEWTKDKKGYIEKADKSWPKIKDDAL